jgi:transcriptional regulator with AAA-type ATPase domain
MEANCLDTSGAFTGAFASKIGLIETASGGWRS